MNPFRRFAKSFLRKRHSRGFGVHSPYAFKFVGDVIRPKNYGYYAYDAINDLPDVSPKIARKAKWFIRLAVFLKAKRFVVSSLSPQALSLAADALGIECRQLKDDKSFGFHPGDFMVIESSTSNLDIIVKALDSSVAVLAVNPDNSLRQFLSRPIQNGLLFEDKNKMLLIPRKEMAYVAYDINF